MSNSNISQDKQFEMINAEDNSVVCFERDSSPQIQVPEIRKHRFKNEDAKKNNEKKIKVSTSAD